MVMKSENMLLLIVGSLIVCGIIYLVLNFNSPMEGCKHILYGTSYGRPVEVCADIIYKELKK